MELRRGIRRDAEFPRDEKQFIEFPGGILTLDGIGRRRGDAYAGNRGFG